MFAVHLPLSRCRESTDEMITKLRQWSSHFSEGLEDNLVTCEELWRLMNESDEYIIIVDTRSAVEMNVSKIKGSISYVFY